MVFSQFIRALLVNIDDKIRVAVGIFVQERTYLFTNPVSGFYDKLLGKHPQSKE